MDLLNIPSVYSVEQYSNILSYFPAYYFHFFYIEVEIPLLYLSYLDLNIFIGMEWISILSRVFLFVFYSYSYSFCLVLQSRTYGQLVLIFYI